MTGEPYKIELSEEEAVIFRALMEGGVFDMTSGSITLHYNNGRLMQIHKQQVVFKV